MGTTLSPSGSPPTDARASTQATQSEQVPDGAVLPLASGVAAGPVSDVVPLGIEGAPGPGPAQGPGEVSSGSVTAMVPLIVRRSQGVPLSGLVSQSPQRLSWLPWPAKFQVPQRGLLQRRKRSQIWAGSLFPV